MNLNDETIREYCGGSDLIVPHPTLIQPASCDLHLGSRFREFRGMGPGFYIDPEAPPANLTQEILIEEGGAYYLPSRSFVLAHTVQVIQMPMNLCCRIEGKSSLGRLGLLTHVTAGFVDPGFKGQLTLELFNLSPYTIMLRPGIRICQVSFTQLNRPAMTPYGAQQLGSKYQGQMGAQEALPMKKLAAKEL